MSDDDGLTDDELLARVPAWPPIIANVDHPLYVALAEAKAALAVATKQVDALLARLDKCEEPAVVGLEVWPALQTVEVLAAHLVDAQAVVE